MLLTKTVKIHATGDTYKYLIEKGYDCVPKGLVEVKVEDLRPKSSARVEFVCDYCGEVSSSPYSDYAKRSGKDCCKNCKTKKMRDTCLELYGVESSMHIPGVAEKMSEMWKERYGDPEYHARIVDKRRNTCIEKYGVDNPMKVKEFVDKCQENGIATCLKRYGVKNAMENPEIYQRQRDSCEKKWGVCSSLMVPEIKEKGKVTMYENSSCPSSKQQRYVCDFYCAKLNYPFGATNLDMYFEDSDIYVEWDGSGHNLSVKYGRETEDEFKEREIKRYKFLRSRGLKMFKIISEKDRVPSDEKLSEMKDVAFYYLKEKDYNWVEFDIENETIRTIEGKSEFKYF